MSDVKEYSDYTAEDKLRIDSALSRLVTANIEEIAMPKNNPNIYNIPGKPSSGRKTPKPSTQKKRPSTRKK